MTLLSVTTKSEIIAVEELSFGPGSTQRVTDGGAKTVQSKLTADSTPPVSAKSHFAKALVAGAGTIDLLALLGSQGETLATTGLRVQAIKVENPNAHQLAVTPAGSNGYGLTFTVPPEGENLMTSTNLLGLVGTGAHLLTLTGTGTETSNWMIILG
jgi:hypothetical protein